MTIIKNKTYKIEMAKGNRKQVVEAKVLSHPTTGSIPKIDIEINNRIYSISARIFKSRVEYTAYKYR